MNVSNEFMEKHKNMMLDALCEGEDMKNVSHGWFRVFCSDIMDKKYGELNNTIVLPIITLLY